MTSSNASGSGTEEIWEKLKSSLLNGGSKKEFQKARHLAKHAVSLEKT